MREADALPPSLARHVDHVCDGFETSWKVWRSGARPRVADFLGVTLEPARSLLVRELIQLDVHYRRGAGEAWSVEEFRAHFPEVDAAWLTHLLNGSEVLEGDTLSPEPRPSAPAVGPATPLRVTPFAGYELLEPIRTGIAVVYKARQLRPQRLAAIKALLPHAGVLTADLQRSSCTRRRRPSHGSTILTSCPSTKWGSRKAGLISA